MSKIHNVTYQGIYNNHTLVSRKIRTHELNEKVQTAIASTGLSRNKLITGLGLNNNTASYLLWKDYNPIKYNGKLKESAEILAHGLGYTIDELWEVHHKVIITNKKFYHEDSSVINNEFWNLIKSLLTNIEYEVVNKFINGYSFVELGIKYNIPRSMVVSIYNKSLRKLSRSKFIKSLRYSK